jgi:lysine 6-dehydrogenase
MPKYAVFGAGMMGRVMVQDLLESESDAEVTLCDVDESSLVETESDRVTIRVVDVTDRTATVNVLREHDVAIGGLPHGRSLALVEAAVEAGTSLVDLVGSGPDQRAALSDRAKVAGCLIVPGCGVAPGISNFCIGQGVELLDETRTGVIYVGGIPKRKRPPLFYETVYLMESVFNACLRPATILERGKEVTVEPMSGLETISFDEVGPLEAYYTDGLASLSLTMQGKIKENLFEKTLRYPGHVERLLFLRECGLLGREPVRVGDDEVIPRDLVLQVLKPHLKLGPEGDLLVMRVMVEGTKSGREVRHTFELIDAYDVEKHHTAMGRTTGYTATIAARMIANGELDDKGVVFPELLFIGSRYQTMVDRLAERGVRVIHREVQGEES